MYKPKVYTASKTYHGATLWQPFIDRYGDYLEFTARWLDQPLGPDHGTTFWTPEQERLHWHQDVQDVKRSDWVIAYRGVNDKLSGTIFECGLATALGIPIFAIGFLETDSWCSLPTVRRCRSINEAFTFILGDFA